MSQTRTQDLTMNDLTTELTAFRSWEHFETRMKNHGYVPTLRTFKTRSKAGMKQNELTMILVARLKSRGFKVFFNGETI